MGEGALHPQGPDPEARRPRPANRQTSKQRGQLRIGLLEIGKNKGSNNTQHHPPVGR